MPEGRQWNGSGTEQPELNLHFVTVFYLQGHPVQTSGKRGHCLLWNCLAPTALLPCCRPGPSHPPRPSPAPPSSCLHEGSERTEFFFLPLTSSHLTFLWKEAWGQIVEVFPCVKTGMGSKAFEKQ